MSKIYQNKVIFLISKHHKEEVIKPIIEEATGCLLTPVKHFDTDRFGTFSREIKRKKSQLETARIKAKKGLKLVKGEIAISSEGSFGQHPYLPIPWNVELIYLYDKQSKLELYGIHESSDTNFEHIITRNFQAILSFSERIGFPDHLLILRPNGTNKGPIIKDIDTLDKLEKAFFKCAVTSPSGEVLAETDMRAHANPTRMKNIKKATENLVFKLLSPCPACGAPGFSITRSITGLPCAQCRLPSDMILKQIYTCPKCHHEEEKPGPNGSFASPMYCHHCNP